MKERTKKSNIDGVLVLLLRVITREDLVMLPKGEKIADILRLK